MFDLTQSPSTIVTTYHTDQKFSLLPSMMKSHDIGIHRGSFMWSMSSNEVYVDGGGRCYIKLSNPHERVYCGQSTLAITISLSDEE